jgi:hypothetical protein
MFCNHQQNNWHELLHMAEFTYNNHHHPSIGMSPFRANNGYDMTLTGEGPTRGRDIPLRLANLHCLQAQCQLWIAQAQERQRGTYNQRHENTPPLKEGDLVWISSQDLSTDRPSPKLEALQFGPFRVSKVMGPLTYRVEIPAQWKVRTDVFHRVKLHLATPAIPGQPNPRPPAPEAAD